MSFLSFAGKNPFRNKLRTFFIIGLLVLGVLALTVSVAFSHFSIQFFGETLTSGGADLNLVTDDYFSLEDLNAIKKIDGVQSAVGVSYYSLQLENGTEYLFNGFYGRPLVSNGNVEGIGDIHLINGNFLSDNSNEVLLTKESSYNTGKKVGDIFPVTAISIMKITNLTPVQIEKDFKVIGIIENLPNNHKDSYPFKLQTNYFTTHPNST